MNPLEAAKALVAGDPTNEAGFCQYCGRGWLSKEPHAPDCPWLQLPRIVEALERLEGIEK